jgi:hypothetical protein
MAVIVKKPTGPIRCVVLASNARDTANEPQLEAVRQLFGYRYQSGHFGDLGPLDHIDLTLKNKADNDGGNGDGGDKTPPKLKARLGPGDSTFWHLRTYGDDGATADEKYDLLHNELYGSRSDFGFAKTFDSLAEAYAFLKSGGRGECLFMVFKHIQIVSLAP